MEKECLLEIKDLKKYYPIRSGLFSKVRNYIKAVDGVCLSIRKGDTVGLVGESGCGKTTLGMTILGLEDATDGEIYFEGKNILELDRKKMRELRRHMQIIFQDPYSSLNSRLKVGDIIGEPFVIHNREIQKAEREKKVLKLMSEVGMRPEYISRYPHEFSGGQRQRIGIGRALALNPKFIICDEPVAALDVSIQGQVLNLLQELQDKYNLTYLFISHDLSVIGHISDRVAVMYLGRIVENATTETIYSHPLHPYTCALISASPIPNPKLERERIILKGDVPSAMEPPSGCHFHSRCLKAFERCDKETPKLKEVEPNHLVRCFLYE